MSQPSNRQNMALTLPTRGGIVRLRFKSHGFCLLNLILQRVRELRSDLQEVGVQRQTFRAGFRPGEGEENRYQTEKLKARKLEILFKKNVKQRTKSVVQRLNFPTDGSTRIT
jgi:hypothetical protein